MSVNAHTICSYQTSNLIAYKNAMAKL